jgi:hypothetical protein
VTSVLCAAVVCRSSIHTSVVAIAVFVAVLFHSTVSIAPHCSTTAYRVHASSSHTQCIDAASSRASSWFLHQNSIKVSLITTNIYAHNALIYPTQIGCDVFSLVELEHCVLKGSATLHKNRTGERIDPKSLPKHWPAAPSQDDPRFKYACTRVSTLTVHH